MESIALIIHYLAVAACTVVAALGVSGGQGRTTQSSFDAINRQPQMQPEIVRATILALAIRETAAIFGLIFSIFLFFSDPPTFPVALAEIGIVLSIALPGFTIGYYSAGPTRESMAAIARQPFLSRKLTNYMLLVLSLLQTPLIFGFISGLLIKLQLPQVTTVGQGLVLIGAGIASGIGCIGPVIGGCLFTKSACRSVGKNSAAFQDLFRFTFISQAIIETPIVFATIIALLLTRIAQTPIEHSIIGVAYLLFGCTIGFGTFGAGISSGRVAASAAEQIAYAPTQYAMLSRASIIAQGLVDTIAIYAFIISLWLILTPLL